MNPGRAAAERFRSRKFLWEYAKGKTAWDPAYPEVAGRLRGRTNTVIDIGCGVGLLAAYLRESGCQQNIMGIDPDANKIAIARECVASHYPALKFDAASAESTENFRGDVVMLDVLHYMSREDQRRLLKRIARSVSQGGLALIRTTFRDRSWRYRMTQLEEVLVRSSGWIRGGRCLFPTAQEVSEPFEEEGLSVTTQPLWGRTPFNSHLISVSANEKDSARDA